MNHLRQQIIIDALEIAESVDNIDYNAIFYSLIHRNFPDHNISQIHGSSETSLNSFFEKTENLEDLIERESLYRYKQDHIYDLINWFVFTWKGKKYEIICTPQRGTHQPIIVISLCGVREITSEIIKIFSKSHVKIEVYQDQYFEEAPEMEKSIKSFGWSDIILPESQLEDIKATVCSFFNNKELYKSLNVTWRRGLIFVSPPGCGKTQLCKVIINQLEVPVLYIKSLTGYESTENALSEIFDKARKISPCIVVLEDLDSIISQQNRSVFLNELDGFYSNDGILLIATSNHPEEIDEAIMKRPSRFDRVFKIELPAKAEREKYITNFIKNSRIFPRFDTLFDIDDFSDEIATKTNGFTLAYVKEIFVGAALEYANQGIKEIDKDYQDKLIEQISRLKKDIKGTNEINKSVGQKEMGFAKNQF